MNHRHLPEIFCLIIAIGSFSTSVDATAEFIDNEFDLSFTRTATKKIIKRSSASQPAKSRKKYDSLIARHARAQGIPVRLAHAVVRIESNYNSLARGRSGEIGLMQLMPATARGIGYRGQMRSLYNPDTNLYWGMKYLGAAYKKAGGNLCGTIMRYNGGLYAKRMSRHAAHYCSRVKVIMKRG